MRPVPRRTALAAACVSALMLAACGKHVASNAPITWAPADTPYLFANFKSTPQDVRQAWNPNSDESVRTSLEQLGRYANQMDTNDPTIAKVVAAIEAELADAHSAQQFADTVGFSQTALFAFYGVGDVPVARVQLASPDKFKAFWARVEKRAGVTTPTGTVAKQGYWIIGGANAKVHLLVAIEGDQLVATIAPANASEAMLGGLLGIDKPASNASDRLAAIDSRHGYGDYGSGYVDLPRLFADALDGKDATTREFVKDLGLGDATRDPACAGEFASLAEQAPLASVGYQAFTARELRMSFDIDLSPSLVGALTALKQPVPGMDSKSDDSMFDIVLALPLQKWQAFIKDRAAAAAGKSYQCPALQSLNTFARTASNPPVPMPPEAASMLGIRLALDKWEIGPQIAGRLLIASSDPGSLTAKIQQTLPQFALKTIPNDGKPVAFDLPPNVQAMLGSGNQGWIAASSAAVAAGIGDGEEARVASALKAPAGDGDTMMRMHMDGKAYALTASWFERFAARLPATSQAQTQQTVEMLKRWGRIVKSQDMDVKLDAKGLHFEGTVLHQ
jgi:hypothetical protein